MRSNTRRAPLRPLIPLSIALACAGCAAMPTSTAPILPALDCAAIIPPSYRQPVPGTPLPAADAAAGDLWSALDDQTARLDQANGRAADLIAMAQDCRDLQSQTLARLKPAPWWAFWESRP